MTAREDVEPKLRLPAKRPGMSPSTKAALLALPYAVLAVILDLGDRTVASYLMLALSSLFLATSYICEAISKPRP